MMDNLNEMLGRIAGGAGSQLIVTCIRDEMGIKFEVSVIDDKGRGYFSTSRPRLNLALAKLDKLAEEWIQENTTA